MTTGLARPLTGAMAFARGELRIGAVRQHAVACHAAAREASTPAAAAVARACGQAAGVAHIAAHARAVPPYVLEAMALTHSANPAVLDSEEAWQRAHVPAGFIEFVYPAG